ncbi:MAG: Gfo/Idh/MocA family oxidoreductase [Acidimicrobiales bacterium]
MTAAPPPPVLDVVLIGAGLRGMISYGMNAEAAGVRFVAVVEPNASRRDAFGDAHAIAPQHRFADVGAWLAGERLADAVLVATPDDQHLAPALAALRSGHHVLLEKPMAQSLDECRQLVEAAEAAGVELHVCHVLRYTPFFQAVADVVRSGRLGRVVTVDHRENVDALHMAHSYVRGAYRREDQSNPMLLAKSCHDLDALHWILADPVVRLSSFGSLTHFRPEAVGPEIPERCTDGCPIEPDCAFSAIRAYAPEVPVAAPEIRLLTQVFPLQDPPTFDATSRRAALATSPFGRCAYRCDNDVVDHQVVAMELASGATVTFTMHGHSHAEGRTLRIDGTRATLRAAFLEVDPEITVSEHGTGRVERIELPDEAASSLGHGGGDLGVLRAFATSLGGHAARGGAAGDGVGLTTDGRTSLESHVVGWAAEEARRSGQVVDVAAFRARQGL